MSEKQENFTLLGGRVIMMRSIYNPTCDAVWLAAYIPVAAIKKIKTVLDVGVGTGGVALCVMNHIPDVAMIGIDVSDELMEICENNAKLNDKEIDLRKLDILKWSTTERFDIVVTNPPYFWGTPSKRSNMHHNTDLESWIKRASARVSSSGYFCTIVDSNCVAQVVSCLHSKRFGDIQILPLFTTKQSAERVLIRARNGSLAGTTLYRGISMNEEAILRDGLTIDAFLSTLETK